MRYSEARRRDRRVVNRRCAGEVERGILGELEFSAVRAEVTLNGEQLVGPHLQQTVGLHEQIGLDDGVANRVERAVHRDRVAGIKI